MTTPAPIPNLDRQIAVRRILVTHIDRHSAGDAIHAVPGILTALAPHLRPATSPIAPPPPRLTPRMRDVLHGIADGRTNSEIGAKHGVSEDTIKTHARRLYAVLGVNERAHAVARAFQLGLLR